VRHAPREFDFAWEDDFIHDGSFTGNRLLTDLHPERNRKSSIAFPRAISASEILAESW
jgi:hypothetical protein